MRQAGIALDEFIECCGRDTAMRSFLVSLAVRGPRDCMIKFSRPYYGRSINDTLYRDILT